MAAALGALARQASAEVRVAPIARDDAAGTQRAIEDAHLEHALVIASDGTTGFSDLDLATNLPLDLYPDQETIIAIDRHDANDAVDCLHSAFPDRKIYSAYGSSEVRIKPW